MLFACGALEKRAADGKYIGRGRQGDKFSEKTQVGAGPEENYIL